MIWSPKTKPTSANIRKRLVAAIEALDGAEALLEASGEKGSRARSIRAHIKNARAWVHGGIAGTEKRAKR